MMGRSSMVRVLVAALVVATVGCSSSSTKHTAPPTSAPRTSTTIAAPAIAHAAATLDATPAAWHLAAARSREGASVVGGRIVVAGGLDTNQRTVATVWSIDPSSGVATAGAPLSIPAHDGAGAVLNGHAAVIGGGAAKVSDAVQSTNPAALLGHLPRPRADLAVGTVGSTVYAIGGYDGTTADPSVLATNDGRAWHEVARLPIPVRYPAVATINGRIVVAGGETGHGDTAAIQIIDPARRRATIAGHLPIATSHASALAMAGAVWVLGGQVNGVASASIVRIDARTATAAAVGTLPAAVHDAAAVAVGDRGFLLGGERERAVDDVVELRPATRSAAAKWQPGQPAFEGRLLIADRGNNRLLVVDAAKRIHWTYPSATAPAPPGGFYFPDDAFFAQGGTRIITNEEENHTIVELAYPSGEVVFSYGHPRRAGSAPGYLNQPDDAYLLRDGRVTVADAKNCRILFIDPRTSRPISQLGTTGACRHRPPSEIGYPNGDTPLANGDFLVSEVHGSFITEFRPNGTVAWSLHLPAVRYPSDPQQLGPDSYLVADYARPGGVYEFTREGAITFAYRPVSGDGMLDHPSLAEVLPNGLIGVNDDYRHRVVLIDPSTGKIVWQYGETDHAGTAPGFLRIPDGFDLLVGTTTPTHPQTG